MVRKWLEERAGGLPMCCEEDFVWENSKEKIGGELAEAFRQAKEEWDTVDPVYEQSGWQDSVGLCFEL